MDKLIELADFKRNLRLLKSKIGKERYQLVLQFQNKINELIMKTPSGELRNEITELNILFEMVIQIDSDLCE